MCKVMLVLKLFFTTYLHLASYMKNKILSRRQHNWLCICCKRKRWWISFFWIYKYTWL